jgi:hypothetical protein
MFNRVFPERTEPPNEGESRMWHEAIPPFRTAAVISMHLTVFTAFLWPILAACRGDSNHWKKLVKISFTAALMVVADVYATSFYLELTRKGWNLDTILGMGAVIIKTIIVIAATTYLVIRFKKNRKVTAQYHTER